LSHKELSFFIVRSPKCSALANFKPVQAPRVKKTA
jgi:hypothetical protein